MCLYRIPCFLKNVFLYSLMVSASVDPVEEDVTVPSARIGSGVILGHSATVGFHAISWPKSCFTLHYENGLS